MAASSLSKPIQDILEDSLASFIKQKQPQEVFYKKSVLKKFRKIYRKTPVPESIF